MPASSQDAEPGTAAGPFVTAGRRRPPNEREQARRRTWGKQWGAVMAEHAKTLRKEPSE